MKVKTCLVALVVTGMFSASSSAQTNGPEVPVVLAGVGGVSVGPGPSGGALGATLSIGVSERLSVEGRGVYFGRGRGAEGFELTASLLMEVLRTGRAAPYLALGGGIYRARFDLDSERFLGAMRAQYPAGTWIAPQQGGFGMMGGGGPIAGRMGSFYANRVGPMQVPSSGMWGIRSFTDPALAIGGGVRIDVSEHLVLRPDVRALLAFRDGRTASFGTFALGVGYRF